MSREVVADSGTDGWGADLSDKQIALCLRDFAMKSSARHRRGFRPDDHTAVFVRRSRAGASLSPQPDEVGRHAGFDLVVARVQEVARGSTCRFTRSPAFVCVTVETVGCI